VKPSKKADTPETKETSGAGGVPLPELKRLKLTSIKDIRQALRRLVRLTALNRMDESKLRSLTYALNVLLNSHRISDSTGGDGTKKLCWDVLQIPEGNLGFLFEFYERFWWAQYAEANPQPSSENRHTYLERLRATFGDPMDKLEVIRERHVIETDHKPDYTVSEPARAETTPKSKREINDECTNHIKAESATEGQLTKIFNSFAGRQLVHEVGHGVMLAKFGQIPAYIYPQNPKASARPKTLRPRVDEYFFSRFRYGARHEKMLKELRAPLCLLAGPAAELFIYGTARPQNMMTLPGQRSACRMQLRRDNR
jgi:hypothetical protein